jgi:hypothetical protein
LGKFPERLLLEKAKEAGEEAAAVVKFTTLP